MRPLRFIVPCATPAVAPTPARHTPPSKALAVLGIALLALSQASIAGDPCAAVMCLSQNKAAPDQCKEHVDAYFNIRVYHAHSVFDPGATAAKRYDQVLTNCSNARQEDKDYVQATYGTLEYYPFGYVSE